MLIQEKVRCLMDERGWTNYKLAKKAGLSESTITNLFKRNNAPTFNTLASICKAFGITMSSFFAEENDPVYLSNEQKQLLLHWSKLNEEQQSILMEIISKI